MTDALLADRGPDQALRRRRRLRRHHARRAGGRAARHHRPERRRQDHADRPAHRRDRARRRPHPLRRPATSPRCRPMTRSLLGLARSFQITSLFLRFHRARQCRARGAGACRAFVPLLARCARARRNCASRRARRSSASVSRDRADIAGRQHEPRRASPARDRDGARRPSRACCCSTSRWPGMGPDESARMVQMLRELKQRTDHPADRARHGGGVRARRPHHRAGLWPRHRLRRRRRRSAPTPRCARPISASRRR